MTCIWIKVLYKYRSVSSVQIYCSYLSIAEEHHKYLKTLNNLSYFTKISCRKKGEVVLLNLILRFCQHDQNFNIYYKVRMSISFKWLLGYVFLVHFQVFQCLQKKYKKLCTCKTNQTVWGYSCSRGYQTKTSWSIKINHDLLPAKYKTFN